MVTGVDVVTALVLTVNVALLAPAATVTLAGTVAVDVLLLERETTAPPVSAGPLSVIVPVEGCAPPTPLGGFGGGEGRGGGGGGGATREWRAVGSRSDSRGGGGGGGGRGAAGEGDNRTASKCWPAQCHRASGGLRAASHTRGIQR